MRHSARFAGKTGYTDAGFYRVLEGHKIPSPARSLRRFKQIFTLYEHIRRAAGDLAILRHAGWRKRAFHGTRSAPANGVNFAGRLQIQAAECFSSADL
ncbi:hypothetical protein KCP71_20350 [Salmonella enterica subsp. enterica]|nr:hypothetical protein KCP71_20350 [Salmonella enterica subsp. enterica]